MTRYSVIEADIQRNEDDILRILKENLTGPSQKRYEWNYKQCPYGFAHCWLVRHEESGSFIGTAALFPRMIFVNGEPVLTAIAGDFAVDKQHRNLRPALALQKEIIHDTRFKFVYSIPNEQSKGILLRIGFKKIGSYVRFIKPLKSEYKSQQYLYSFLRYNILARAADIVIKGFAQESRYKTTVPYSIEIPEYFDDRFTLFWKNLSKQSIIIGEKTPDFLNWRYGQSPEQNYEIFCLLDGHKEIMGYCVYFIEKNMCHIMDMVYKPSTEVLSLLLAEFSRFMRMKGAGSISVYYMGGSLLEEKLQEFNFVPIMEEMNDVILYCPDPADNPGLFKKENWHFFAGDNDV